jgi:magnesium chelatase subunit D
LAAGTVPVGLRRAFPFTAVVGQERVKKAVLCALASPSISAVLIMGPAGTAKSTIARAADGLVPGCRVINLPLNATEEQVVGGMDLEAALVSGEKKALPGILRRADGNILYIDGINLMPELLVHTVLDASSCGQNIVEREGISWSHECRFLLIGTMDPEEGKLSRHLMDRFDIIVPMSPSDDSRERMEILRRALRYELDPTGFREEYRQAEDEVAKKVQMARERSPYVMIPSGHLDAIAKLCHDLAVDGHRGDLALARTASALAALDGREQVTLDDLQEAVPLCLEYRRNDQDREAMPPPPKDQDQSPEPPKDKPPQDQKQDQNRDNPPPRPPQESESPPPVPPLNTGAKEQVFSVGQPFVVIDYIGEDGRQRSSSSGHGRRDRVVTSDRSGRYTRFQIPQGAVRDLAFDASIRAAAPYQKTRHRDGLAVALEVPDLREKVRERKRGTKILFLVDASGSMGARQRMVAVKGAVLALLRDAYQKRDQVGMMAFRKQSAELLLPPTRSVYLASKKLEQMPTGGRTPLALGLSKGYELLMKDGVRGPRERPVMVVLTDGRANVPLAAGEPFQEALSLANRMAGSGIRFIVVDTGAGFPRLNLAMRLCQALEGTYFRLEELDANYLASSVRAVMKN